MKHIKNRLESRLKKILKENDPTTLVAELERATPELRFKLFKTLPLEKSEKIFSYLEPVHQAEIIEAIDRRDALRLLETMEPDDRVRLFSELSAETIDQFFHHLSSKERLATSLLLKYPAESAGRIMSPFFVSLEAQTIVEEALQKIRKQGQEAETIYVLPVVDKQQALQGMIELDKLVMAQPTQKIADLMDTEIKSFSVYDDQEKVARFIQSSDWLAVPIVEKNNQVVGLVTIDDAMNVMEEEETEDIIRGSASGPLGKPYLSVSILRLTQVRILWLALLAIAGTLTVNVLNAFETTLQEVVVLALFIPLLIGIGGNTGSQSATTIVRALAVDDIRVSDFLKVAIRECAVGILLGISLGVAAYLVVWLIFKPNIALIVSLSLLIICAMATLTGSLMPLLARSLNLDPAVVSAPFVSTVIDATGLLVYFIIAKTILQL